MSSSASPGLEPPPGNPRFPHLDALRALAALSVVFFHSGLGTPGYPFVLHASVPLELIEHLSGGVTLFFLLSGFLLYRPFAQARARRKPPPSARIFWWRRILRVIPAYWVALTVLAIWPGLADVHSGDWWRYYLLLQTWSASTVENGLSQAWTLCVEAQFYLLLPFFALALSRLDRWFGQRTANRLEVLVLIGVNLASVAYTHHFVYGSHLHGSGTAVRFDGLPATMQWFTIGMMLAVISARDPAGRGSALLWLRRRPATAAAWIASAALYVYISLGSPDPTASIYLQGVVYLLLLAPPTIAPADRGPQRILLHPVLAWLGLISYGIYLWHGSAVAELILHHVGHPGTIGAIEVFLIAAPLGAALGAVSYYAVERPFLRLKAAGWTPFDRHPASARS